MGERRAAYTIVVGDPEGKRRLGRHRLDGRTTDLRKVCCWA
jgi:hypothetical protein